ncbi:MAG: IPT/TIG domain-containing protein, partial [Blastocatellia bacterium]
PARMEVTLTQPAPSGGLVVQLASGATAVARVPASITIPAGQTTAAFNATRTGPGVAFIEARATLAGNALSTIAVITVARPAPQLSGVTPSSGPPGARILIAGAGFSALSDRNIVGFVRNNNLVAVLDPEENEIRFDAAGRPVLRIVAPAIAAGPAGIVVASIDPFTGIISDTSAPIAFTVLASNVPTPQLAGVNPAQGKPRDTITINGANFSPAAGENQIVFRQGLIESQARILRATATQIVAEVPSQNVAKGEAVIIARRLAANGAISNASNALDFTFTEDPSAPARPAIASVVNAATGQSSGRDGDVLRLTGTNFGRNFYDVETDDVGNDEPLISLLLYFQNNQLLNFSLPIAAQGGTQISTVLPSGLNAGPVLIFALTFDLESGLNSDESNPATFNVTVSSIRRIDEDEPNDTIDTATEVFLPLIVDGRASKDDPSELSIRFNDGTSENLPDLFSLELDKTTAVAFTLNLTLPADLDLFVLREDDDGGYDIIGSSTRKN